MQSKCGACGRFVDCKPGSGSRFDFTPDSVFGPEIAEWLCPGCAAKTPLPPPALTAEQAREVERRNADRRARAMGLPPYDQPPSF